MKELTIEMHVDGASKGNHDKSVESKAYTCVVIPSKDYSKHYESIRYAGNLSNNEAEWKALLEGIKKAKELGVRSVKIYSDSNLVVQQFNGRWKCKSQEMKAYYDQCRKEANGMHVHLFWV